MPTSTSPSNGFTSGAATSLTVSHTSDTNPLYVWLSWFVSAGGTDTTDVVTGVTFNGVALTRGNRAPVAGNTMEWWRLDAPASGAHNVVVSLSAARRISAGIVNLTGWPTSLAEHQFAASGAKTAPPSVTVTSAAEVISWIGFNDPTQNVTAPGGSTALWNQEGLGGGSGASGDQVSAACLVASSGNVTVTWTGSVADEYFGVAALAYVPTSRYNLLTGDGHTVEGADNFIAGTGGTVTGDRNALFALCGGSPAPAITGDNTFLVCADAIELNAGTVTVNGASVATGITAGAITGSGLTMASGKLLGRSSASTGAIEEITVGSGLLLSGGTLSTTGVAGGASVVVRKASDESVTSSAALQDDDDFTLSIGANELWFIEFHLFIDGASAGDWQGALNVPTGATGHWSGQRLDQTAGTATSNVGLSATTDLTDTGFRITGTITGTTVYAHMIAFITNSTTPGTVKLRWAQAVSNGTATTIKAGSVMVATRLL